MTLCYWCLQRDFRETQTWSHTNIATIVDVNITMLVGSLDNIALRQVI